MGNCGVAIEFNLRDEGRWDVIAAKAFCAREDEVVVGVRRVVGWCCFSETRSCRNATLQKMERASSCGGMRFA